MAEREEEELMIERGSGNVFADLRFENAAEMLAKAQLVHAISEALSASDVSQAQMAAIIGVDQSKVSKLLRGITDGFSSDRLLRILNRLDQDVEIIIRPKPSDETRSAHVSVAIVRSA
jgi:predicted XRE-type DNA-binding protein